MEGVASSACLSASGKRTARSWSRQTLPSGGQTRQEGSAFACIPDPQNAHIPPAALRTIPTTQTIIQAQVLRHLCRTGQGSAMEEPQPATSPARQSRAWEAPFWASGAPQLRTARVQEHACAPQQPRNVARKETGVAHREIGLHGPVQGVGFHRDKSVLMLSL
jgi:hypothetical protein